MIRSKELLDAGTLLRVKANIRLAPEEGGGSPAGEAGSSEFPRWLVVDGQGKAPLRLFGCASRPTAGPVSLFFSFFFIPVFCSFLPFSILLSVFL